MLIAGASGHAIEILSILKKENPKIIPVFFDDTSSTTSEISQDYQILRTLDEASLYFNTSPSFILGVGKPIYRKILFEKLKSVAGEIQSIISSHASIGNYKVELGKGLNIFPFASITARISIGFGTLVHSHVSIHHDCSIGDFCELSPGCRILGGVSIGDSVSIGAGAIILPGCRVGTGAIVGAGAVVTKDVAANALVAGIPAKPLY